MAENPSDNDQPLDALTGHEFRAHALSHGYVLDDSLADFQFSLSGEMPWEDVEASRRNRRLQGKHPTTEGKSQYLAKAKPCPKCNTSADALGWFYFRSPKETWPMLCGIAGWMAVCDRCHIQVNFFDEVMS
jgi:hypothetical protein